MSRHRDFLRSLVHDNPPLLAAVIDCNRRFPARIRPDAVPPEKRDLLALVRSDEARSSRFLGRLSLLGEPDKTDEESVWTRWALDFRVPRHRLALLPPDTLVRLARWFGLVRYREEIAKLIDRDAVIALRDEVGEEGRRFALRRSALLPASREENGAGRDADSRPLVERIRHSGFSAVAACLSDAPFPLVPRLGLTVPEDFAERLADRTAAETDEAARHWPLLRTLLFKEIGPEWETCFS